MIGSGSMLFAIITKLFSLFLLVSFTPTYDTKIRERDSKPRPLRLFVFKMAAVLLRSLRTVSTRQPCLRTPVLRISSETPNALVQRKDHLSPEERKAPEDIVSTTNQRIII